MDAGKRLAIQGILGGLTLGAAKCASCQDIFPRTNQLVPQTPPAADGRIFPQSTRSAIKNHRPSSLESSVACADFSSFSEADGMPAGISRQSGIPWLDHVLSQELYVMMHVFGLMPAFFFYDDAGGSNALATSMQFGGPQFPVGTVLIGRRLTSELLGKYHGRSPISSGDHAIGAVVAHEWAHIAQFASGVALGSGKAPELHADFLSGWYQAGRVLSGLGTININFFEAASELYSRGDFDFNSPQHHGIPEERVAAYSAGMAVARSGTLNFQQAFYAGLDHIS